MAPRSIKRRAARNAKPEENKQLLVNMPIDVLIEIFPYLEPLDLLHLCRTTKGLRAFLLNRNKCSTLWKSVISNVGGYHSIPTCPDHISAPAYTHLAFVPVCHGCFGPCETVEWQLRMRCCSNCWQDMTIPRPRSVYRSPHADIYDVKLPTTSTHYQLDFAADDSDKTGDTDDTDFAIGVTSNSFPAVCSRLDLKTAKSRRRPKGVPMDEFVAEQNKFWDSVRKHARLCDNWEEGRLRDKAVHLTRVRKQRRRDIIKNMLSELNPKSNISETPMFSQLPEVREPEPLTPAEWAKIKPQLEKANEDWVWKRHVYAYKHKIPRIQKELVKDPAVKVKPETIDIAMLSVVRSMLESDVLIPNETISFLELAYKVRTRLSRVVPQAIRKWSSDAVEELESLARERLYLSPLSKPSRLPSVIFRCKQCNERLVFDKALSHLHLYKERCKEDRNTSTMSIHEHLQLEYMWLPRDIGVLQVDVTSSRRVENLIRRMGKNPSRVTYDELCRWPVKVACSVCRMPTNMDFKAAFDHCLVAHLWKTETEIWTRISAARKIAETSEDE